MQNKGRPFYREDNKTFRTHISYFLGGFVCSLWTRPPLTPTHHQRLAARKDVVTKRTPGVFSRAVSSAAMGARTAVEAVGTKEGAEAQAAEVIAFGEKLPQGSRREKGRVWVCVCFFRDKWFLSEFSCQREGEELVDGEKWEIIRRQLLRRHNWTGFPRAEDATRLRACWGELPRGQGGSCPRPEQKEGGRQEGHNDVMLGQKADLKGVFS